jgi:aldehyde dehydrogenase (NAD+)
MNVLDTLKEIGVDIARQEGRGLEPHSPIDGQPTVGLRTTTLDEGSAILERANAAFHRWRTVPAPLRGELVRRFGNELRTHKAQLARLVTLEAGKITQEALGEVQEMIDICDFAVGLSRQLHGLTIASERPGHHMRETWHPMGVCGIITAFNFPVAVWAWNAALALVCGNAVVWKPSEKTPLTALAVQAIFERVASDFGDAPDGLSAVLLGSQELGRMLADDARVTIVSATGSTAMGRDVSRRVAQRFGRCILELSGNNAAIVTPAADLDLAVRAILFAAVGTTGQRCTTLRRAIAHTEIADELVDRLKKAYDHVPIGNPLDEGILLGPLIDQRAYAAMEAALAQARKEGSQVFGGERVAIPNLDGGYYVRPALVEMPGQTDLVRHETFAPILYVLRYRDLDEAIALNNDVNQGLSSSIFTNDLREAEHFLGATGSDCGIANVNIGTSGAEIGGAFGGEKETGGGRESGSDAWKGYMRRSTNTVNFSRELPLAQGIRFDAVT